MTNGTHDMFELSAKLNWWPL